MRGGEAFGARARLPSILGARGAASAVVYISHLIVAVFPDRKLWPGMPDALQPLIEAPASAAVLYFFVLSGFLLTWNWKPDRSMSTYARARVGRIWPAHAAMWAMWVVLSVAVWRRPLEDAPVMVSNLFLLQGWVLSTDWQLSMNGPTWTLSSEALMYAVLPLLVVGNTVRVTRAVLVAVISLGVIFAAFMGIGPIENLLAWPLAALLPLVIGVMAAHGMTTREDLDWRGRRATLALGVAAAFAVVMVVVVGAAGGLVGVGVPAATAFWLTAMVIGGLTVTRLAQGDLSRRRSSVLRTRPMQVLGDHSFSLYLVHIPAILTVVHFMGGPASTTWGAVAASVAATLLTAAMTVALYRLVERPAYILFTRRGHRGAQLPTTDDVPSREPKPSGSGPRDP